MDSSYGHLARCFAKVFISPQGQLCMWLNRPRVSSDCLVQVAAMGSKFGHSSSALASGSMRNPDMEILLINDTVFNLEESGCGQSRNGSSMSLSDGRSALLVGVVSNLLKATGQNVCHHRGNWPLSVSIPFVRPWDLRVEGQSPRTQILSLRVGV